jgi:hypothetical protein
VLAAYFLGRLDGHTPRLDVESLIERELPKLGSGELQSESTRCGILLAEKGKEIQLIGKKLVER